MGKKKSGGKKRAPVLELQAPVETVTRSQALALIKSATRQARRLKKRSNEEALHDFRVALRRLRTWLRTYGAYLPVSDKLVDKLGSLASSTGGARDNEITIEWLRTQRSKVGVTQRVGLDWLVPRLEDESAEHYERICHDAPKQWSKLESQLTRALSGERLSGIRGASFGQVCGRLLAATRRRLESRLSAVHTLADMEMAHRARIQVKRLRYLVDPLSAELPSARSAASGLKALQEILGQLSDCEVVLDELARATEAAGSARAERLRVRSLADKVDSRRLQAELRRDELAGLVKLIVLARQWQEATFRKLQRGYLTDDAQALLAPVRETEAVLIEQR